MGHLWSGCFGTIIVFNHTVMELWRHSNDHVIVVWVEMSSLWNIKTEWRIVMISSHQVIRIVDETWRVGSSLR